MFINVETLNRLLERFGQDPDDLELITGALTSMENYHRAIYELELTRRLNGCGLLTGDDYRQRFQRQDATRTRCHNDRLSRIAMLNRLAEEAGLPPVYDGTISEETPFRRQVADATLAFVNDVMLNRL